MEWLDFGEKKKKKKKSFALLANGGFWKDVTGPTHSCLRTPFVEGSNHHVIHLFLFALTFA